MVARPLRMTASSVISYRILRYNHSVRYFKIPGTLLLFLVGTFVDLRNLPWSERCVEEGICANSRSLSKSDRINSEYLVAFGNLRRPRMSVISRLRDAVLSGRSRFRHGPDGDRITMRGLKTIYVAKSDYLWAKLVRDESLDSNWEIEYPISTQMCFQICNTLFGRT